MNPLIGALILLLSIASPQLQSAQLEPFEGSDAEGHLVSRGQREHLPDGTYIRQGTWQYFAPDGHLTQLIQYVDDVPNGLDLRYSNGMGRKVALHLVRAFLKKDGKQVSGWDLGAAHDHDTLFDIDGWYVKAKDGTVYKSGTGASVAEFENYMAARKEISEREPLESIEPKPARTTSDLRLENLDENGEPKK